MSARPSARERRDHVLRIVLPIVVLALGVAVWEAVVRIENIPPYILPGPGLILQTLIADWALLFQSLVVTLTTTIEGFLLAAVGGVGLAVLGNTTLGRNSVDRNLAELFALYGASRWQVLWNLKLPSALPYMLRGLR